MLLMRIVHCCQTLVRFTKSGKSVFHFAYESFASNFVEPDDLYVARIIIGQDKMMRTSEFA